MQNSQQDALQEPCFYNVLGVHRKASDNEIKKAYRQKAMEWHPDKNSHRQDESEHNFKLVGESYEVLKDPQRRALYDRHGRDGLNRKHVEPDGHVYKEDYHFKSPRDIFSDFFQQEDPFAGLDAHFNGQFGSFFGGMGNPHEAYHQRAHNEARGRRENTQMTNPFANDPFFSSFMRQSPFNSMMGEGGGGMNSMFSSSSSSFSMGFGEGATQRQTSTRIVNGQRTTSTRITDAEGNVTVTEEFPSGEKKITVNGMPQPRMMTGSGDSRPQQRVEGYSDYAM